MKRRNRLSKWVALAVTGLGGVSLVAMVVAMMAVTGVSLVTPDPAFAKFDVSKLTIGGDLRVRGEFRRGTTWAGSGHRTGPDRGYPPSRARTKTCAPAAERTDPSWSRSVSRPHPTLDRIRDV